MHDLAALLLDARMDMTLAAIDEIARADDLATHEKSLRLSQLSACARGLPCPELAFDPTALRLRAIADALRDRPVERDAWNARVLRALERSAAATQRHASAA